MYGALATVFLTISRLLLFSRTKRMSFSEVVAFVLGLTITFPTFFSVFLVANETTTDTSNVYFIITTCSAVAAALIFDLTNFSRTAKYNTFNNVLLLILPLAIVAMFVIGLNGMSSASWH